jgi:hypothetical protein
MTNKKRSSEETLLESIEFFKKYSNKAESYREASYVDQKMESLDAWEWFFVTCRGLQNINNVFLKHYREVIEEKQHLRRILILTLSLPENATMDQIEEKAKKFGVFTNILIQKAVDAEEEAKINERNK